MKRKPNRRCNSNKKLIFMKEMTVAHTHKVIQPTNKSHQRCLTYLHCRWQRSRHCRLMFAKRYSNSRCSHIKLVILHSCCTSTKACLASKTFTLTPFHESSMSSTFNYCTVLLKMVHACR